MDAPPPVISLQPDHTFDPAWLIEAAARERPDDWGLRSAFRACTRYLGGDDAMIYFVSPERANRPGAAWQFESSTPLDNTRYGEVGLLHLTDGRIGKLTLYAALQRTEDRWKTTRLGMDPAGAELHALAWQSIDIASDDAAELARRVRAHPVLLDVAVASDESLLHWLAIEDATAAVAALIELGADVNRRTEDGDDILGDAASAASAATVRVLATAGADLTYAAPFLGGAALHRVGECDAAAKIDVLLDAGADIQGTGFMGATPLHSMVSRGSVAAVRRLLERGADANARDDWGAPPLHEINSDASVELIEALVQGGADLLARDDSAATALHHAAYYGGERILRYLLAAGLDPRARTSDNGETPIDRAQRGEKPAIAGLLEAWTG